MCVFNCRFVLKRSSHEIMSHESVILSTSFNHMKYCHLNVSLHEGHTRVPSLRTRAAFSSMFTSGTSHSSILMISSNGPSPIFYTNTNLKCLCLSSCSPCQLGSPIPSRWQRQIKKHLAWQKFCVDKSSEMNPHYPVKSSQGCQTLLVTKLIIMTIDHPPPKGSIMQRFIMKWTINGI